MPAPAEIATARATAGLTQAQAAALIEQPVRRWQDWEYGAHRMHPQMWRLWLHCAGIERIPFPPGPNAENGGGVSRSPPAALYLATTLS